MHSNADQTRVLTEEFINSRAALLGYVSGLLRSHKDAEDIVQESYIKLVQARDIGVVDYPKAYIFRVARNVTLDHMRRTKRANTAANIIKFELDGACEHATPEGWLLADECVQQKLDTMASLPPKCRKVFALRKFQGLSHKEIASRMGISVRTVENHIAKATKACRECADA